MNEPIVHSHITDVLPENDTRAYECVYCDYCHNMVHCSNNECMDTWFEFPDYNLCAECFGPYVSQWTLGYNKEFVWEKLKEIIGPK